jgi:hypothetical protein
MSVGGSSKLHVRVQAVSRQKTAVLLHAESIVLRSELSPGLGTLFEDCTVNSGQTFCSSALLPSKRCSAQSLWVNIR